jgi:hypothetical protein
MVWLGNRFNQSRPWNSSNPQKLKGGGGIENGEKIYEGGLVKCVIGSTKGK